MEIPVICSGGDDAVTTDRVPFTARLLVFHAKPGPGVAGEMELNTPLYPAALNSLKLLPAANGVAEMLVTVSVPP